MSAGENRVEIASVGGPWGLVTGMDSPDGLMGRTCGSIVMASLLIHSLTPGMFLALRTWWESTEPGPERAEEMDNKRENKHIGSLCMINALKPTKQGTGVENAFVGAGTLGRWDAGPGCCFSWSCGILWGQVHPRQGRSLHSGPEVRRSRYDPQPGEEGARTQGDLLARARRVGFMIKVVEVHG